MKSAMTDTFVTFNHVDQVHIILNRVPVPDNAQLAFGNAALDPYKGLEKNLKQLSSNTEYLLSGFLVDVITE